MKPSQLEASAHRLVKQLSSMTKKRRILAGMAAALLLASSSAQAASGTWKNSGTSTWNTTTNWTGGVPGGATNSGNLDVATFSGAAVVQPNLNSSGISTMGELQFTTTATGYDITHTGSVTFTLNSVGTGASAAINAQNTTGTNTLDTNVILGGAASTTQEFNQASGGTLVINGVVSGGAGATLNLVANGNITLNGANTFTSALGVSGAGTVTVGGTLQGGNAIADNGTLIFKSSSNQTLSGVLSGSGSLTQAGTGTLSITTSTTNNYSGGTKIINGTVSIAQGTSLGTGTVTLGDSTGSNGAALYLGAAGGITLANNIIVGSASGTTSGTLALGINESVFHGGTFGGTITLDNNLTITEVQTANFTNPLQFGASTLSTASGGISAGTSGLKTVTITPNASSVANGVIVLAGAITDGSGQVAVTVNGPGDVSLANLNTTTTNTFSGGLNVVQGQLEVNGSALNTEMGTGTITLGASGNTGNATIQFHNSATYSNNIFTAAGNTSALTIQDLAGSQTVAGTITLGSDLTLANVSAATNQVTTYSGASGSTPGTAVTGTGNLNVLNSAANTGSGLTISGAVTNTGNVTVTNNSTATTPGAVTLSGNVNNAGTILNNGTSTGNVSFSGGIGSGGSGNVTSVEQSSATSALSIGTITVASPGTTLTADSGASSISVSGGTAGVGNLILNNNTSTVNDIGFSVTALNNIGTITNSGTGTGGENIAVVLGNGGSVTDVIENSANSVLTLSSASNFYSGSTNVQKGTVAFTNGNTGANFGQSLGLGNAVNLGVAGTSSGTLQFIGTGTDTLAKTVNVLGNGSDTIQNSGGGLLTLSGSLVKNGTTLTLNGGANGIKVTGVISGSNGATHNSDLDVMGGTTTISTLATYDGPTWIFGSGVLANGVTGGALPVGTTLNIGSASSGGTQSAGTFDLAGNSQTVAVLNTAGSGSTFTNDIVTNSGAATAALTVSNGGTFAGVIKNGTGTTTLKVTGGLLSLAGANTYTGSTSVTGGTLNLTSTGSLASGGSVSVGGLSGAPATATIGGTGTFNGPVTIHAGNGNVGHIAPGVNTSGNFGSAGTLSITGALTIGGGSALDIDLSSSTSSGNDLIAMSGGTLSIGATLTFNINALGTLQTSSNSGASNYYTIINGAGTLVGTALTSVTPTFNITGSTDVGHLITSGNGNNLEIYFTAGAVSSPAIQSFTAPTPSPLRIIAGATTTVTATLQNTVASGNNALNVSLTNSSTGGHGSVTSFSGTNPTTVAAASSSPVSGTFTAGTAGSGTWGITNTDATATPTTASTSNTVTVYSKSTPSLSTSTANFGLVHQGATVAAQTTNLQNAAGTFVAGLQVTSLGGLTNVGGQTLIAAGGSDALSAPVSTATAGVYSQNYTVGTQDDSTIVGASANTGQVFSVTGNIYTGFMVWSGASDNTYANNSNWNDSNGSGVHAAPGLDSGFQGVDTATFGANAATSVSVGLNGAAPNLNSITFSSPGTNYTLAQNVSAGTGTSSVTLSGTTPSINVTNPSASSTAGTQTISAPVVLGATTSLNVAINQTLNISGAISSTGAFGLSNTGPGATVLSNSTGNTYSGPTTITGGKLSVNNATGSGTGTGAVTVGVAATGTANSGTLAGKGVITSSALKVNGGGTLSSTDPSLINVAGTGFVPDGLGHQVGGMTLANTPATIGSSLGTAQLVFALGTGTSGINNGPASGQGDFSNPNNNTTYLKLTGSTTINFAGSTSIALVDLTNGGLTTLRLGSPYLLIHAGADANYLNLVIASGFGVNATYSLSQGGSDGYVLGVATGVGTLGTAASYTAIPIGQYGPDGVTALSNPYPAPTLYLAGGNLEVVPEPGTWALMMGGLALLVVIQRRRSRS